MEFILGIIVFVLDVWALYHIVTSAETTGKKVLWGLGILIFPIVGFIVWYFAGPRSATA
ncbi:MAG: PLD nuclease N-terminal domain-containing protein [Paracoccaceae bacterium]